MKVLLDTSILSEARRPNADPRLLSVLRGLPGTDVYISVLTLGELAKGVRLAPSATREALAFWVAGIERDYADRVIPVGRDIAVLWGELEASLRLKGTPVPAVDALIAATALSRGMHVLTRNTRHFAPTGVLMVEI